MSAPPDHEARIAKLEAEVAELRTFVAAVRGAIVGGSAEEVADDAELDSKFGDPPIRKDPTPRFWQGESFKGKRLSQTTPAYLDAYAKYKETCARMTEKGGDPTKAKYAGYDRKDAARARGWAQRLRDGWTPPTPATRAPAGNPFASDGAPAPRANPFGNPPPAPPSSGRGRVFDPDGDVSFPFGANAAPPDDDEDLPL